MRRCFLSFVAGLVLPVGAHAQSAADIATLRPAAERIVAAAMADTLPYARLGFLVDRFGHRLSGSTALERAIDWILAEMKRDGFANVRGEPVMVPHWVRGHEEAPLEVPRAVRLHRRPFLSDPRDDLVLELAVEAGVTCIVTHNLRDFAGTEQFGIDVLSPGAFWRRLEAQA